MNWHVLIVRPQREFSVASRLDRWEQLPGPKPRAYVPLDADKRKGPLFPGYVLVECDEEQSGDLRSIDYVVRVAGVLEPGEYERVVAVERQGAERVVGELREGASVVAKFFGVTIEGMVVEQRKDRVGIVADLLSRCIVWVERSKVTLI